MPPTNASGSVSKMTEASARKPSAIRSNTNTSAHGERDGHGQCFECALLLFELPAEIDVVVAR